MTQFITIPCKKGYEIKFIDSISNYIRETYGAEQCNNHKGAFIEFNNMRTKMLNKLFDKHESTISVLTKYHDQFVALEGKIPIEENGVRIDFKWDDAFGKESVFGKKNSLQIASGGYERICILFNIAALYSQVAEIQNLSDDNGLKNATKYLQQAAGIFSYLKSATGTVIQREPTTDLNADTLGTLSTIMLAQAQELIYTKAAKDHMKEGNVAKIVQQSADLYADSLKLMQLNSVKSIWPKEWIPLVAGKQASYHAIAEYYQAKACGVNHAFGEQIARLKKASELMKTASIRAGQKFNFRTEQERIKKDLQTIEKENNMIYHDNIPDIDSLSPIMKAVLARELPLENPIDKDFKDLFSAIVPLALLASMNMFQNKQKSLLNTEIYRLKEATNTLGGILASLNLPALLEDNDGGEVPSVLLQKAATIRADGGIGKIDEIKNSLPDAVRRNEELLAESKKMLDEEEVSDRKLKEQFKHQWNRTPSYTLTGAWRGEWEMINTRVKMGKNSDEIIKKNYQESYAQIKILSQNESVIKESIPKSGGTNSSTMSQSIKQEVRKVYDSIESMKVARASLITELGNYGQNDLATQFSKALTIDRSLNHEQVADDQLNKMLAPLRERVHQSLDAQDKLVTSLHEKCVKWTDNSSGVESRASVISSLMLATDKYKELLSNLQEGLKFYSDLTEILIKFQNKVRDFCFARKTEKDELMKDLQTAIVKERSDINSLSTTLQATSSGTVVNNQTAPNANSQQLQPNYPSNAPVVNNALNQPMAPGVPYPINTPYMAGVPPPYQNQQYGYQNQPQRPPGQMPQYPPPGFNYPPYPSYNPNYPR